jgi:cytochrome c oxidase subunit 2
MSGASSSAGTVDAVFLFIVGVSLFFLLLITFLMIFFIIKYNKKRHKKAENIHGNTALEIIWTVIPTIIVLVMFYLGWKGFAFIRSAPEDSMTVTVNARMWSWLFEYENGIQTDTLYVPVNRPVKLLLQSQDVIHSFFIPAFRIKEDAVPGYQNYLWFEANEAGNYDVLCAEYCGLRHAYMYTKVKVLTENEFLSWQATMLEQVEKEEDLQTSGDSQDAVSPTFAGKRLLRTKGCIACHSSDGSEMIGPTFQGIFGKNQIVLVDGDEQQVVVDEEYLRRSILKPNQEVVKGYNALMPSQEGQITEEELVAIIQHLKEL